MKSFKLFYIIFILYTLSLYINIINSSACPNKVDYTFEDAECDSDMRSFDMPVVYISNFYQYINITCDPSPISTIYNQDNYQITLDYSTDYTITLSNPNCPNGAQKIYISTSDGPRLLVTQPKCLNSYAIIDFDDGNGTSYNQRTFEIGIERVDLPYEMLYGSIYSYYFTSYRNGNDECAKSFYLNQGDSDILVPEFQVFPATCSKDGRILISNTAAYSSITLYDASSNSITPTSGSGNFENLNVGLYYMILESPECGKQRFDFTINDNPPPITISLIDDSCPKYPVYQVEIGDYSFSLVNTQGTPLTLPFIRENGQQIVANINNCGKYTLPFNDIKSYPPVHYTVSSNTFCQEIATLEYNTTQLPDLLVQYENTNIQETYNVTMIDQFSFNVYEPRMFIYKLSSPQCYTESIQFTAAKREPHIIISSKTQYCNELVDIKVTNYLDFQSLYLYTYGTNYYAINGEFKQVPNIPYQLYYQHSTCNTASKEINQEAYDYEAYVYYSSEVTTNSNCDLRVPTPGIISTQVWDAFTNESILNTTNEFYYYDSSPLYVIYSGSCSIQMSLDFIVPEPIVIITTIEKPICSYQLDGGYITINSNIGIYNLYINGNLMDTSQASFEVSPGENIISIDFTNYCGTYETVYYVEPQFPDFKVEYDIIPVTNCVDGFGGFTIRDYTNYIYLGMDGIPLTLGTTGSEYPSKTFPLEFSIQLGNSSQICSGIADIFVSTSIQIIPSYRVVHKPLCPFDDSGAVVIDSIKDSSDKEYSIDLVNGNPYSYIYGIKPGDHLVNVESGICSWNINISVAAYVNNVTITPVLDFYTVDYCLGYARYKLTYSDDLAAYQSTVGENNDPVLKFYSIVPSNSRKEEIEVFYSSRCSSIVTLKAIKPTIPSIIYHVTSNGNNDCLSSSTTINIQVENFKDYSSLVYAGISIDSDGLFTNVLPGSTIIGSLFSLSCTLEETVLVESPVINYLSTNETCNEGYNGQVQIQDPNKDNYYYLLQNINNIDQLDYKSSYPILSNTETSDFGLVGSNKFKILRIGKSNPSCIVENEFELTSVEPELLITVNDQCSLELGSVSIITNPTGLSGTYELGDPNTPTPTPTTTSTPSIPPPLVNGDQFIMETRNIDYTGIANNISSGNYSLTYTITSEYCKRKFFSYVNIPYQSSVNVSATACQTVQFTPVNLTALYYYKIFNPNHQSTETLNNTGIFTYTSFKESGTYILQVQIGTCIKNHTIQIETCGGKKNNIGLIVGLVIGLIALAGIIAAGIFIYKKRVSSTKVNDIEGIQHELNTVKVYTGNKLQELDKF